MRNQIEQAVLSTQTDRSVAAVRAVGSVGDADAHTFLTRALLGAELSPETLTAIATALARQPQGEQFLAETVAAEKLPAQLSFTVANLLHVSQNPAHRAIAAQHLPLPKTKSGKPLPPLKELVKRSGDPVAGRALFFSKAQCATCHRVTGEGKFVGPDLTEIGSKLSKQVLYTSILDPSAAISHNYENHELVNLDGKMETGILLSRSEAKIEIKNAEGIVRSFPASEIESLRKLPISLMPAGIEKQLTAEELVDLVEYLLSLKQPR
jgi:putative heme-binding domain-containing protein